MVADRCGRRFVMLCGTVSTIVLSVIFGCSTTFTMAFASRFMLGFLNAGVIVTARTLVSEVCASKKHETIGMGVMTASWTAGGVLGPGVGGLLAEPAEHHPSTFSEDGIFGSSLKAPTYSCYAFGGAGDDKSYGGINDHDRNGGRIDDNLEADNASAAKTQSAGTVLKEVGVQTVSPSNYEYQENLMSRDFERNLLGQTNGGSLQNSSNDSKQKSLLAQGHIRVLVFINGIFAVVYSGFDDIFPLWALTSSGKGGLDWSSPHIGKVFLLSGLVVLGFELLAVPYLTPWLGIKKSQRISTMFEIPVYLAVPLISWLNNDGLPVFFIVVVQLFMCYTCSNAFLLALSVSINNAAGSERRAELNGISITIESMARAMSPMAFSTLFAFSVNGSYPYLFDYRFPFYLLALVRLVAGCTGWNKITDNTTIE
eukprot:jgi/Undpi1/10481/HiC_scaffold_29.g12931.m1